MRSNKIFDVFPREEIEFMYFEYMNSKNEFNTFEKEMN